MFLGDLLLNQGLVGACLLPANALAAANAFGRGLACDFVITKFY